MVWRVYSSCMNSKICHYGALDNTMRIWCLYLRERVFLWRVGLVWMTDNPHSIACEPQMGLLPMVWKINTIFFAVCHFIEDHTTNYCSIYVLNKDWSIFFWLASDVDYTNQSSNQMDNALMTSRTLKWHLLATQISILFEDFSSIIQTYLTATCWDIWSKNLSNYTK